MKNTAKTQLRTTGEYHATNSTSETSLRAAGARPTARGISYKIALIALVLVGMGLGVCRKSYASENQDLWAFNQDFTNTTGSVVNDFHVLLRPDSSIGITGTWESGQIPFPNVSFINRGSTVEVSWSGASLEPGQSTHVGVEAQLASGGAQIIGSWWSINGDPYKPHPIDGTMLSPYFGGDFGFTVTRISLFDDSSGTHRIGTDWAEGPGELLSMINGTPDGPVFASFATLTSSTRIPLEDLNGSLTGFGADSQIMEFDAVPEPGTLVLFGSSVLGLGGLLRRSLLR